MEQTTEKKWFIYLGDHHEGPFSVDEIKHRVTSGAFHSGHYCWKEGMPDWKVMKDVPDFSFVSQPKVSESAPVFQIPEAEPVAEPVAEPMAEVVAESMDVALEPVALEPVVAEPVAEPIREEPKIRMSATPKASTLGHQVFDEVEIERVKKLAYQQEKGKGAWNLDEEEAIHRKKRKRKFLFLIFLFALGTSYFGGYLEPVLKNPAVEKITIAGKEAVMGFLSPLAEKIPAVAEWISPVPTLKDVSLEELAQLRRVATAPLTQGPKVAVAISTSDIKKPTFYVSSNLPDGSQFEVLLYGQPETILNHWDATLRRTVYTVKQMARTSPFEWSPGVAIPQGLYTVYVYETSAQSAQVTQLLAGYPASVKQPPPETLPGGVKRKMVDFKTYFLGGTEDDTYRVRLKEYHDKLQVQVKSELENLLQYSNTLSTGAQEALKQFARNRNPNFQKSHRQRLSLFAQLHNEFQKWTPEYLRQTYFHSNLFLEMKLASEVLGRLYALQQLYLDRKEDKAVFESQYQETQTLVQTTFETLRARIKKASELGTTPNGMPQRVE